MGATYPHEGTLFEAAGIIVTIRMGLVQEAAGYERVGVLG